MSTALIIFAKAPVAGLAKTRLIPALGAQGAAALAEKLLDHAVSQALATGCAHVELCVTPDATHAAFERLLSQAKGQLRLSVQGEGDLGQRMDRALTRCLLKYERALLMGTDAPGLNAEVLNAADHALANHEAVFVPALDGGYALVGLTRPEPRLFASLRWSTPQVMVESRARAKQIGLRWIEFTPIADIDEPADLVHLPPGWLL